MMEIDDEIVETIPVYLNKSLADSIHLLQYPVLGHSINLNNAHVVNSCIKPTTQQLKVDFALNTDSQNYDGFKGEQLGVVADGKGSGKTSGKNVEKPTFKSGRMDKLSYVSSIAAQDVNRFVVGVMKDGELHLSPINQIYQMRPSFTYFDKQDKRTKAEAKKDDDPVEDEIRQVTVKFAKNENDRARKAREKSFNYLNQLKDDEPWCETMWYPAESDYSSIEKQKLTLSATDPRQDFLNLSKEMYIKCLVADPNKDSACSSSNKVEDIIVNVLKSAKMLTYPIILSKLPPDTRNTDKIFATLQAVATLIRGNWVLKSEILYPEKMVSHINGVTSNYMVRAREFVLFKLSVQDSLDRQQITQSTQLPMEEAKEVLESVGKYEVGRGWVMLLPPNDEYEEKYPELVQRRKAYWDGKQSEFQEMELMRLHKPSRKRSHRDSK